MLLILGVFRYFNNHHSFLTFNIKNNLNKPLKIAVYSGKIPSTTFIERLIKGVASKEQKILLFGIKNQFIKYPQNIFSFAYKNNVISKGFHFLKYWFLLAMFNPKEKRLLDSLLQAQNRNTWNDKLKSYPVLYHKPELFHIQWAKSIEDWMWVQEFGIKLMVSLRGAHINYSPIADADLANTYQNLFPKVDGFHAVSKAISQEALKYNAAFNKIKVVYSGLDLNQLSLQLKNRNGKTPLRILSIGRAHWIKGYSYALSSMKLLKMKEIYFHYTIVGVNNNEELVYQRSQLGLKNEVTFIEKLPFEEVVEKIKLADVVLLSSVKEGIANVVLEAMALGTLVIATNCGGINEVIIHNENGFLVPIRDSESMARALEKVSGLTLTSFQKITKAARITIENQHNSKKMIDEMQDLYLKVFKS